MRSRVALLAVLAGLFLACSDLGPPPPPEYRVEFVYAVAEDSESRFDVLQDSILQSIQLVDDYLYELTGRRLKTDGTVREVVLPFTREFLAGNYVNQRADDYLDPPEGTIVHVYYDGPNHIACGHAAWPPVVPGQVSSTYLQALGCSHFPFLKWWHGEDGTGTKWLYPRGYREWSMMHEVFHVMGMVPPGTPNSYHGHVADPNDLMCCTPGYVRRVSCFLQIGDSYRDALLASPWLR